MKTPQHVGFIMDGNRRWAKKHGFKVFQGHEAGVNNIEDIVQYAKDKKIKFLSFWAFSTDNWKRNKLEVTALMNIFRNVLSGPLAHRLIKKGVKINIIGDISRFSEDIQERAALLIKNSKENKSIIVNLCLNYGGREEIITSINKVLKEGKKTITEEDISSHLYTHGQPEVDLIIRTSGEQRHNGFLLWQSKNAEYYYSDVNWPEFDEKEFEKALEDYDSRQRRFGK
jgi:undecaprenyl diphosphate synthase